MLTKLIRPIHPSYCFYVLVWSVIAGIIFGVILGLNLTYNLILLLISFCLIFVSLFRPCIFTASLIIIAGLILGNFRTSAQLTDAETVARLENQTVWIIGKISDYPDTSQGSPVLRIKDFYIYLSQPNNSGQTDPVENFLKTVEKSSQNVENSEATVEKLLNSANFTQISGNLYVTLANQAELERSDLVIIKGKLGAGFGAFVGKIYRASLLYFERTQTGDIFARFRQWFAERVRDFIPSPEVDLGLGYLMGLKTGLSEDFTEALQATGMTHVVVASGAHLAILIGAAKKIFGKISKIAGIFGALLLIFAFVMIVGFTPSMTRAALVASLSLVVGYVGRKFTPLRLIGFVMMLTLLIDPSFLLNLGWQLSFASFFGILVVSPRLARNFYGVKQPPWLASMLITSISTSLICAPILIYSFGLLSLLSLLANLIILPTLPYAMFLMMLVGAFSFTPFLAGIIAQPTTWLLDLHIFIVNFLSEKTTFILTIPAGDSKIYLLYIPVFVFLVWPALRRWQRRFLSSKNNAKQLPTIANDAE